MLSVYYFIISRILNKIDKTDVLAHQSFFFGVWRGFIYSRVLEAGGTPLTKQVDIYLK